MLFTKTFHSKSCFLEKLFSSRPCFPKMHVKCKIGQFYGVNWTKNVTFCVQNFFQNLLFKNIFFFKIVRFKNKFFFKIWRVVKFLFQSLTRLEISAPESHFQLAFCIFRIVLLTETKNFLCYKEFIRKHTKLLS